MDELRDNIEELREKLQSLLKDRELIDPLIVNYSQMLDVLIVKFEMNNIDEN